MKTISSPFMTGFFSLLLTACITQQTQHARTAEVYEKILDNGLKILVKPDTRAPVVISQVWYKVGGSYEPPGQTGVSHVLEHMMFKGTDTLGPNEFSRIIAEHGGRENAFTGRDYTAYFQTLEKSRLEIAFELEADRMGSLTLSPDEFAKEIEVVKEERRSRTDDRPESLAYEQFMATAFTASNYRNPIIGWPRDLASMKVENLRHWYQRFYAPNNATLVVVGDVEPEHVFALAKQYFGRIPRRTVIASLDPAEPEQTERRHVDVIAFAKVPYMILGYHVPVISSTEKSAQWEPYALEIAAYLLDGGKSARLTTELVRRQRLASSIGVSYNLVSRKPTLFVVEANPATGISLEMLETAIKTQIRRLQTELVSEKELARVKAQIIAGKVYKEDSGFYQGMRLGTLETSGLSWQMGEALYDRLRAITAEHVQDVARKYLVEENLTSATLKTEAAENGEG